MNSEKKAEFKSFLQKDIYLCHDPQYCFNCGRSIVGRNVTIEKATEDRRYIWEFCQVEHVIEDVSIPDEPFEIIHRS